MSYLNIMETYTRACVIQRLKPININQIYDRRFNACQIQILIKNNNNNDNTYTLDV